ncbi:Rossmann fold nucleotide-binding protein [Nocardioides sp. WS12]|uniref:LOG family protein n=1 Tax=Nocardioides sp. WS12 TaxID=2486272 RepID=UPI0015F965EC|nr:Rossmann fold nucleotide-binding protein [Nocardioides sp. WS12]
MRSTRARSVVVASRTDTDRQLEADASAVACAHLAGLDLERTTLYSPDELFDQPTYAASFDARADLWARSTSGPAEALAEVLHDQAIDTALATWVREQTLVGVMGGHAAQRGSTEYDDAARLGALLGRTHVIATGGGPGAMEAANLGGRFAHGSTEALLAALATVATVPSFLPSVDAWTTAARQALELCPDPAPTLGVPTWHYGYEPPNVFATAVAKYFRNALREAILLQVCDAGIVFLPGAGGTVQEIFQDACENYYAAEDAVAPMVLVGRRYWTEDLPAWPLLQALARGRPMEQHIHLVETIDEAAALFVARRPGHRPAR